MYGTYKRKRKLYTEQQMKDAIAAVKSGFKLYHAAHTFRVPKATLHDKIYGRYAEDATPGAQTKLTKEEEGRVVTFILYLSNVCFTVTRQHITSSVLKYLEHISKADAFKNSAPSRNWYTGFLARHPEVINSIYPNPINPIRTMRDWFGHMQTFLKTDKEVFTDPRRVFTCDESTFFRSTKDNRNVVVLRDTNKAYKRSTNDKRESITLLLSASADGQIPPPCLVYPSKQLQEDIKLNVPANWSWKQNEFGRMDIDIMYEYMTKDFYPWLLERDIPFPVVLFMDLQSCHIDVLLSEFCAEKQIILTSLVQNTLHPIDTAVLRPFTHYCINQMPEKAQNAVFKIEDFAKVFDTYFQEGLRDLNLSKDIGNEFRTCKLYPFGTDTVLTKKYGRNRDVPLENNMDVDSPLIIEDGILEKGAEKNKDSVPGLIWQGDRSFSAFLESQNVIAEPSPSPASGSLQVATLPVDPLNPVSTTYLDIIETSGTSNTVSISSDKNQVMERETPRKSLRTYESFKVKTKSLNKNEENTAYSVISGSSKLKMQRVRVNYSPYDRRQREKPETFCDIGSEPEIAMNVEGNETRDPLEALAVPGSSRLGPKFDNTAQNKQAHYVLTEAAQDFASSKSASNEPIPELSSPESFSIDIKDEINADEIGDIADLSAGSQSDVPESDFSNNIIELSNFRTHAAESNSDSSVYFETKTAQKPKRRVTTELLFQRYKLKSKREIDRLHSKIRELKASLEKYKRKVYRLQKRSDNVKVEK